MAFRIEAAVGTLLVVSMVCAAAGNGLDVRPAKVTVLHAHLHGSGEGELEITAAGVRFTEAGKHSGHSRTWAYSDIQQLDLQPDAIRILTYEDSKWELGRDREYLFEGLPEHFTSSVAGELRDRLGLRLLDTVSKTGGGNVAIPAKLVENVSGAEGTLHLGNNQIAFESKHASKRRVWPIDAIESVQRSGPYDLTITAYERPRWSHHQTSEFHFQLKEPLSEANYQVLWRAVNAAQGLNDLNSLLEKTNHHDSQK